MSMHDPGAELCQGLRLGALPALMLDGELRAVGVQTLAEARALLDGTLAESTSPRTCWP